jgi:rhodanese-related sulfurtransferase
MTSRAPWLCLLALALSVPAHAQLPDENAVPRITVAALKAALDAGQVLVLDIRDAGSYADGRIPGAVLVPLESIRAKAPGLKGTTKPIVAYCA